MKKVFAVVLTLMIAAVALCGCDSQKNKSEKGNDLKIVTDLNGNTVTIPGEITGAASNSASVTSHIVMIAGADSVKIAPASFKSGHTEQFEELFSGTTNIPLSDGNKISAEKLLESGVNLFFTTKQEEADEYAKAGMVCLVVNYDTIDTIAETFQLIGKIFGGEAEKRGTAVSENILEIKKTVEEMNKSTNKTDNPTIYYISASTQTTPYLTQGLGTSIDTLLKMCGATLVSPGTGLDVQVNPEFLLEKDPDYILIDGYLAKEAYYELKNDLNLKELKAVANNQIVISPVGYFRPLLRPGAESGVGLLWLAKTFGTGIDESYLESAALDFYSTCFNYDLKKQDIHNMLNWAE